MERLSAKFTGHRSEAQGARPKRVEIVEEVE